MTGCTGTRIRLRFFSDFFFERAFFISVLERESFFSLVFFLLMYVQVCLLYVGVGERNREERVLFFRLLFFVRYMQLYFALLGLFFSRRSLRQATAGGLSVPCTAPAAWTVVSSLVSFTCFTWGRFFSRRSCRRQAEAEGLSVRTPSQPHETLWVL